MTTTTNEVRPAGTDEESTSPLDRLAARARGVAAEVRERIGDGGEGGLRATLDRTAERDAEAWRTYGERVEGIAAEADVRMAEARAELDVALADTRDELREAASRLIDEWQGRLDDLKVQAALARMDAADEVDPGIAVVEAQLRRVARRAAEVKDASAESIDVLRTSIGEAAELVREGFDEALVALRRRDSLSR